MKKTILPKSDKLIINPNIQTCVYNYYNLDPLWRTVNKANRILIIEPSIFEKHPISKKCMDFMLELSKNIENIQIFTGEYTELTKLIINNNIYYKEHPLNSHYTGNREK